MKRRKRDKKEKKEEEEAKVGEELDSNAERKERYCGPAWYGTTVSACGRCPYTLPTTQLGEP
jgi:hypothetical protein